MSEAPVDSVHSQETEKIHTRNPTGEQKGNDSPGCPHRAIRRNGKKEKKEIINLKNRYIV